MDLFEVSELSIYRGRDVHINKGITVTIPTIGQIEEFDEEKYFSAIYTLTSVGADLKWQLWDMGIDYTTIDDYDLFVKLISQLVSSKKNLCGKVDELKEQCGEEIDIESLKVNPLSLILKDIDFADFAPYQEDGKDIVLYNKEKDITFGKLSYLKTMEVVRQIHGLKRNNQIPANERTKLDLIEDARDAALAAKSKPYKSAIKPLVSTLQCKCGQCGDNKIWDMPVSAFFDNVKRIGRIQDAELLLQGAYSGFASLKGVDKSRLNMFNDV